MPQLSQSTQKLIQQYQDWYRSLQPKEGISTIHVDEVASKVAAFYEKIKGVVDWREEHLLRKQAIERSLKRRIFFKEREAKELADGNAKILNSKTLNKHLQKSRFMRKR